MSEEKLDQMFQQRNDERWEQRNDERFEQSNGERWEQRNDERQRNDGRWEQRSDEGSEQRNDERQEQRNDEGSRQRHDERCEQKKDDMSQQRNDERSKQKHDEVGTNPGGFLQKQDRFQKELPRPAPPVVGKVTHYNLELYWEEAMAEAVAAVDKKDGRVRVCLQEHDKEGEWGNLYSGYAKRHTVSGLDPQTEYKYRMRMMNSAGNSDWSAHVRVTTTKEPMNGEHLHRALGRRDLEMLEKIIHSGDVKVDVPDKYGFSGLMQASIKGYVEEAELLLNHGADVHLKNDAGKTALMLACYAGNLEVVKLLRQFGACYLDFDRGGSAAIHWAVDGGNVKLIDWMIEDGADVNLRDLNSGWTPLIRCACVSGHRNVGISLLQAGADINAQDKDGKTTLMTTILNGHQELLKVLLQKNANVVVKNEYGKTAYDMAMSMEKRPIIKTLTEHMEAKGHKMY